MVVDVFHTLASALVGHHLGDEYQLEPGICHVAATPKCWRRHASSFASSGEDGAEAPEETIKRLQAQLKQAREGVHPTASPAKAGTKATESVGVMKPASNLAAVESTTKDAGNAAQHNEADKLATADAPDAPVSKEAKHAVASEESTTNDAGNAAQHNVVGKLASVDVPDAPVSKEAKHAFASDTPPDPKRRSTKLRSTAECASSDGRYIVKVTPDGVRRLYDTNSPGLILTRIQCDGEQRNGDFGDCGKVSWPCENMRRPFEGYMEDITKKIQPLCQKPSWQGFFVGLGGGYMQSNFAKVCAPDARIDTVEASPSVVPIAKNVFGFDTHGPKQHVEFGDALHAMNSHVSAGDKYDFMFTDQPGSNREFLETAHHMLKPSGSLAFSKVGKYDDEWLGTLQEYFTPAKPTKTAEGNYTLIVTPKRLSQDGPPKLASTKDADLAPQKEEQPVVAVPKAL